MIFRKLSELGSPGMTSRWAGKLYAQIKRERPELNDYGIIDLILWARFNTVLAKPEQYAAAQCLRHTIRNMVDAVEFILDQESHYSRSTPGQIRIMNEVIGEQLCKSGIPHHMIFGRVEDTPSEPPALKVNQIDCPYCQQTLRIPAITEETQFRCPSCKLEFNVRP